MLVMLGLIAAALAAGALIYLAVKLTVAVLKQYRMKKNSKVLVTMVKDLIKQAPTIKLDDLDDDDVILAEYDEDEDKLVQDISAARNVDGHVRDILNMNGGIVVFD